MKCGIFWNRIWGKYNVSLFKVQRHLFHFSFYDFVFRLVHNSARLLFLWFVALWYFLKTVRLMQLLQLIGRIFVRKLLLRKTHGKFVNQLIAIKMLSHNGTRHQSEWKVIEKFKYPALDVAVLSMRVKGCVFMVAMNWMAPLRAISSSPFLDISLLCYTTLSL